ncbi:MAG: IS1634 family transposase [Actinomycetota bacterium]|nr:IS1634 family transposase [Actinomycetota bacterium]
MGRLVDLGEASLEERRIGALPIVNAFMERLGLRGLLDGYVVAGPRASLAPSAPLLVLLQSLVVERAPVYKIAEWVAGRPEALLGPHPGEIAALNDDRLGRALDALFCADRASMLTALMTKAIEVFTISLDELHNDATTLHMQGEYASSVGDSSRAPRVRFGHAKERPDLAQLIYLLTVSSDGYVPITYRLADGNTSEDPTHIPTWESCCVLAGTTSFLYVRDAKLCNRSAMGHIDRNHGRFLCVMPATRAEVGEFRRFIAANTPAWTEVARRKGKRKDDPDKVFYATPAPSPSVEGYRICWSRSTTKELDDAAKRRRAIEAARVATEALCERLSGPRCRLKDEASVKAAATAAIDQAGASRWVRAEISTTTVVRHRQQRRGRPGPNTLYVRIEEQRYQVRAVVMDDVVRDDACFDACFDGCWPAMTSDKNLTEAELLFAMKRQPGVEGRHHVLKSVVGFVPVYLKSNERIDAFAFLGYVAVLVHALIERELRNAMRDATIAALPSLPREPGLQGADRSPGDRDLRAPVRSRAWVAGEVVASFHPTLSKLHRQVLDLLNVPATAYQAETVTTL